MIRGIYLSKKYVNSMQRENDAILESDNFGFLFFDNFKWMVLASNLINIHPHCNLGYGLNIVKIGMLTLCTPLVLLAA